MIILSSILAILIVAAGFYVTWGVLYVNNMVSSPSLSSSMPTSSLTPTPTIKNLNISGATATDSANWLTYKNTKVGFQFMYPAGSSLESMGGAGNYVPPPVSKIASQDVFFIRYPRIASIQFGYMPFSGTLQGFMNFLQKNNFYIFTYIYPNPIKQDIIFNGIMGYEISTTPKPYKPAGQSAIVFVDNGYGFYLINASSTDSATIEEITKTFHFTNNSQTSCNTDADCRTGEKCMTVGPIIANRPLHKTCVKEGTAVPL